MSFTNTSPFLTPTRSKVPALGTNPLAVAAGGRGDDKFVLDMATTAVAVGKVIEICANIFIQVDPTLWAGQKLLTPK